MEVNHGSNIQIISNLKQSTPGTCFNQLIEGNKLHVCSQGRLEKHQIWVIIQAVKQHEPASETEYVIEH